MEDKWDKLGKQCGLSFRKPDGTFKPVNEWLDDLYLQYTSEQIFNIVDCIFEKAEMLFEDQITPRAK